MIKVFAITVVALALLVGCIIFAGGCVFISVEPGAFRNEWRPVKTLKSDQPQTRPACVE